MFMKGDEHRMVNRIAIIDAFFQIDREMFTIKKVAEFLQLFLFVFLMSRNILYYSFLMQERT